VNLINNRGE